MKLPEFNTQPQPPEPNPQNQEGMTPDIFMYGVAQNVAQLGKLMKQRFVYESPAQVPHYAELSQMTPNERRGFGEEGNRKSKYSFVQSVPYGRQATNTGTFMYQRLGAYYQNKDVLAIAHFIDFGDARGPSIDAEAVLNVVALRAPSALDCLMWYTSENGIEAITDKMQIANKYDEFVVAEVEELHATHTRETAVPLAARNSVRPVLKGLGIAKQFGEIARKGRQQ